MAKDWKAIKAEIDAENTRTLDVVPEDIARVFTYDVCLTGAGTGGLMLGPWIEGATANRYIGPYFIYNILKLGYGVQEIKDMVALLLPKVTATAKLCGMATYARFTEEVMDCVAEIDDAEGIDAILNSLYLYGSNMNGWTHHCMKWGIGYAFKIPHKDDLKKMGERACEAYE